MAIYESNEDAGATVAEITALGITPVAIEMLDGVMLRMVEEATHAGYPLDAAAVQKRSGRRFDCEPRARRGRTCRVRRSKCATTPTRSCTRPRSC